MKKLIIIVLTALLIQGCSFSDKKQYQEKVELYESYYKSILNNDKFASNSEHFAVQADIDKVDEGYVYEIIIDDAKIAMYDVKVMVVEDQKDFNEEEKMMPSAGIFDEKIYNIIPNQSNVEKGYMSGFQLLGEAATDTISLEILVIFNDYRKLNTYREFISFDLEYKDPKDKEEDKDKEEVEDDETLDSEEELESEEAEAEVEEESETSD